MAELINGDIAVLYAHDGTSYRPIACLTSNSLSEARAINETQTKCDPGVTTRSAGTYSYEISCEGKYIDTTSVGSEVTKASHDFLRSIITSSTGIVNWKMDTGLADTVAYYGNAIMTGLDGAFPAGDDATFSSSLSGNGSIVTVDPLA